MMSVGAWGFILDDFRWWAARVVTCRMAVMRLANHRRDMFGNVVDAVDAVDAVECGSASPH